MGAASSSLTDERDQTRLNGSRSAPCRSDRLRAEMSADLDLLRRIDACLDAAPRTGARAEAIDHSRCS